MKKQAEVSASSISLPVTTENLKTSKKRRNLMSCCRITVPGETSTLKKRTGVLFGNFEKIPSEVPRSCFAVLRGIICKTTHFPNFDSDKDNHKASNTFYL